MDWLFAILGISVGVFLTWLFLVFKRKQVIRNDVEVVMSALSKVSKLVTVEGEFHEIYSHSDSQPVLFNLLNSEKKAIVMLKAKVLMGYDLSKLNYEVDTINKKIIIKDKPEPEILNLWTDAEYYDVKHGSFNRFSKDELAQIKDDAKKFLLDKIHNSDLPKMTAEQTNIGLSLLEDTTKSLGWKLKY